MILSLHEQARLFLLTILMGGGMGLLYDGLRVFRHALPHKPLWVQLEDGLFWLLAVFLVFGIMLHASGGEIRFFSIFGLFAGMGLYFLTLSCFVITISDTIIRLVRYLIELFFRILLTPFHLLWMPFRRPVRKIVDFCDKCRKKLLQSCKVCVKMKIRHLRLDWRMLHKK